MWVTVPITGTGGGFVRTVGVKLLYHGERSYLPLILKLGTLVDPAGVWAESLIAIVGRPVGAMISAIWY